MMMVMAASGPQPQLCSFCSPSHLGNNIPPDHQALPLAHKWTEGIFCRARISTSWLLLLCNWNLGKALVSVVSYNGSIPRPRSPARSQWLLLFLHSKSTWRREQNQIMMLIGQAQWNVKHGPIRWLTKVATLKSFQAHIKISTVGHTPQVWF